MKRLLLSLILILSTFLLAQVENDLLPVNKAFIFKAELVNNKILLNWKIKKNYFLYKEKIKISADFSAQLGNAKFPKTKIRNDEFFGKIGIYRDNVIVVIPILKKGAKSILLTVNYQGCSDLGVCYPPITKSVVLDISSINSTSLDNNSLNLLSQVTNKIQSLVKNNILTSGKPLSVDNAFKFSVVAINDNTLLAKWDISQEYYLYHNKFLFDIKGAKFGNIVVSKGKIKNDKFIGEIEVHKDVLEVEIPLTDINTKSITLIIKYQGCWEGGVCFSPQEKTINIMLPSQTNNPKINILSEKKSIYTPNIVQIKLNKTDQITALFQQDNILLILASFFGFGLLLSLTPCVFPMIPILSGIIIGQKAKVSTKKALIMSIVFVLSMSIAYSIVGVFAGYFGENLQVLFQAPWVLSIFSLIFVTLAFSMFGYYEIQLPTRLQEKITKINNDQEGGHLISVAVMGFLSALIIGPCVTPPLAGILIYIGQTGDALLGGISLFIMSLGMGSLLIVVGAGISKLPKADGWMENVKYVFGILMLAIAIYLLDRIISPLTSLILWAMLITISPIAMGTLNTQINTSKPWQRIFKALGLIILGYGILLWILVARGGGDMLQPLSSWKSSNVGTESNHLKFKQIKSISNLEEVLAQAKNNNQIVMLDFYANWCISCKELELFIFSNAYIVNEMSDIIALQVDVTENNINDKALMKRFNIVGPPAILFFKNGIENRSQRIIGDINAQNFLSHLNKIK
ncbi:MAG: protein-disulfide reductase DsbD [Candidatus Vesicomyosocius endoextente]|uniref:Protein-disulfide reductase DsbD n=1 Tax=Candidatus Vesicomyosocius endoextente TaxID=2738853 RepID=A0A853G8W0_9GAMM|nr:protein-disulfide reductase DsbD [Candidatus Vesicomyosocius endoextente]